MKPQEPIVLTKPAQVRAVSSPVAHQVISVMERVRRCTVAELAAHTGIEAGSLYYHVRKLKGAGVLAECEKRSTGGRQEVVYRLTGSEVVFDPDGTSPSFLRELCRSVRVRLRYVERAFVAALETRKARRASVGRSTPDPTLHQHHARLGPADRRELYRRIEALEAFLIERDDPQLTSFVSVTIAVLPEERPS